VKSGAGAIRTSALMRLARPSALAFLAFFNGQQQRDPAAHGRTDQNRFRRCLGLDHRRGIIAAMIQLCHR
jgi:hypothetical protein